MRVPVRSFVVPALLASALLSAALMAACSGSRSATRPDHDAEIVAIDEASSLVRDAQRLELAGETDQAIDKYTKAIATYRELPVAWNNLGRLLMLKEENLRAVDAFKTAADLSPTDPRPLYNIGTLWEQLGYLDDAAKWYDESLARDQNFLPALRRRVLVDQIRDHADERTFENCRRALLIEKDPWWIDRIKRAELRLQMTDADSRSKP